MNKVCRKYVFQTITMDLLFEVKPKLQQFKFNQGNREP